MNGLKIMQYKQKYDIVFVCTYFFPLRAFLMPLASFLKKDFSVCVIANISTEEKETIINEFGKDIAIHKLPVLRKPNIFYDIKALWKLTLFLKNTNPKLVFSIMPKTGLIAMIASYMCSIERRVHCFTGQVWVNKKNLSRLFYKNVDRLIVLLSSKILADGNGQRKFLISQKVVIPSKIEIIWNGSIAGVDFKKIYLSTLDKNILRKSLGFSREDVIILFMSRMTREKGFIEVLNAYKQLSQLSEKYKLLLIGPDDENLVSDSKILADMNVVHINYVNNPSKYIQISDIFVSPSYREGLPMTLLEALSYNSKAFVSNIYGNNDLVKHGFNGFLHQPGDWITLSQQIENFLSKKIKLSCGDCSELIKSKYDREVFADFFKKFILNQMNIMKD